VVELVETLTGTPGGRACRDPGGGTRWSTLSRPWQRDPVVELVETLAAGLGGRACRDPSGGTRWSSLSRP